MRHHKNEAKNSKMFQTTIVTGFLYNMYGSTDSKINRFSFMFDYLETYKLHNFCLNPLSFMIPKSFILFKDLNSCCVLNLYKSLGTYQTTIRHTYNTYIQFMLLLFFSSVLFCYIILHTSHIEHTYLYTCLS